MSTPARPAMGELQAQLSDGTLAGEWILDAQRSTVALRTKVMWGLSSIKGIFGELEGAATISPAGEITGHFAVAAGSIDTRNRKRDAHLRSGDFFLSDVHPVITFTLSTLTPVGDGALIFGILTIREQSRPTTFSARASRLGDGAIALDATPQIDRSQFGLTWNQLGLASMKNTVTIHAVFTKS